MTSADEISSEIDHAAGMIDSFRNAASDGANVDLSGLDKRVESLCANIAALQPATRNRYKSTLLALIDDLNQLVKILEIQQTEVSQNLKGVSSRQRAVSAYGKGADSNAVGPEKKPK